MRGPYAVLVLAQQVKHSPNFFCLHGHLCCSHAWLRTQPAVGAPKQRARCAVTLMPDKGCCKGRPESEPAGQAAVQRGGGARLPQLLEHGRVAPYMPRPAPGRCA